MSISSRKYTEAVFGPRHGGLSHALGGSEYELKWGISTITSSLMKEWRVIASGMLQFDIFYIEYVVCNYIKREDMTQPTGSWDCWQSTDLLYFTEIP